MKKSHKHDSDSLGHSLWDTIISGEESRQYLERDDGEIGGELNHQYFAKYNEWPVHVKQALKLVKGRVLDIGCGAGKHAIYLQRHGFNVTGIDISPLAIRVCKKLGLKKARVMSIQHMTLEKASFETVIMLWNNFGLFGSRIGVKKALKKLAVATTPRAKIIAEFRDPYQSKDPLHIEYGRRNRARGRMSGQLRIRVRYKTFVGQWIDYLFASKKEIIALMRGTDWQVKQFFGPGPQYIVILEKKS